MSAFSRCNAVLENRSRRLASVVSHSSQDESFKHGVRSRADFMGPHTMDSHSEKYSGFSFL